LSAPAFADVNLYSYREAKLLQPVLEAFTKDTGIKVNLVSANSGLEQRIATEGANSPADVLLTVDIGRLEEAKRLGITQPIKSEALDKVIPANFRDADHAWYGVSARARVFYVSKDRVPAGTTITYEELADPKWKGKICTRPGQHQYNNGLIAAFIAHYGVEAAEKWLTGVKANLAQKPTGGDREVARDILAGKCDVGIANTYYWALMNNNDPEKKPWADATRVILPIFKDTGGTHFNVSGVILAKHAPNKADAMKFIEWLGGEHAQHVYADATYEYPLRTGIKVNPTIAGYGEVTPDKTPLSKIAAERKAAADLVDKVGFDK
jgi:iron(III) transport system substrate-binding protein